MFCISSWTQSSYDNKLVIFVFIFAVFAFVIESQLTQYVQTTLNYKHPFFLFWIVHSSFAISFPIHLAYLKLATPHSLSAIWKGLVFANAQHLDGLDERSIKFQKSRFIILTLKLTALISLPALFWFAAIELAPVTDVTAIWNTNSFFVYLISIKVFGLKLEGRKLGAVIIATCGVLAVVYGGTTTSDISKDVSVNAIPIPQSPKPLIGDVLTLIASICYAAYLVFYKKYAALPSAPEFDEDYRPLSASDDPESNALHASHSRLEADPGLSDKVYPLPFGLYSNLWTSAIGICTFSFFWIIPILHWTGVEPFAFPSNIHTLGAIAGIVLTGCLFNVGFMITLAFWGPIVTSVGGLLTIVLVFLSDILLGATDSLTIWGVAGSATIVAAFGVIAYDMLQQG
ncbi:hypothetical protein BDP27DRAFT_1414790 [Rhodocollybia butyracea]|uniref:EamA domain-containing protein n=1 Tax=Rhodocollybia butyracea TaxID=206335 RepID=A0A9P5Q7U2_9AGAR|nr:hypothetical protein BDP27DRAFT_1414790 [Rhodocollybia butyracea]